jgi:hypothetical protein
VKRRISRSWAVVKRRRVGSNRSRSPMAVGIGGLPSLGSESDTDQPARRHRGRNSVGRPDERAGQSKAQPQSRAAAERLGAAPEFLLRSERPRERLAPRRRSLERGGADRRPVGIGDARPYGDRSGVRCAATPRGAGWVGSRHRRRAGGGSRRGARPGRAAQRRVRAWPPARDGLAAGPLDRPRAA